MSPRGILLGVLASQAQEVVPPVVVNSQLWLDAADLATITESGGDVSQWDNKGTLSNFTQGTGALQPTTGVSTLNGYNVLNFAGDFLTGVTTNEWKFLHDGTKHLIAAVWQPGTTANPGVKYRLLGTTQRSNQVGAIFGYDDDDGNDGIEQQIVRGVSASFVVENVSYDVMTANAFNLTTVLGDPSNGTAANRSEMFVNAGSALKNNSDTAAVSTSNPSKSLQIGATGNSTSILTGKIAEIVIVSGAEATEGNRVIIRDYLNAKWGVF